MIRSLHIDTAQTWRGGQNQVLLTVSGLEELGVPAVLVAHESGELKRRAREGLRFIGFAPKSEFDVHAAWQLNKVFTDIKPNGKADTFGHCSVMLVHIPESERRE